jgi:hypothetical protein
MALTVTVFALLWGVVLVRLPTVLRDAKQRAMWATCFTLALCKVAALPSVTARLERVTSIAEILPHLLAIACVYFLLRFISLITDRYASRPRAAAYQLILTCAVTVTLVVLAVLSPGGVKSSGTQLLTAAVPAPTVAYWVVLNTYLGGILAAAIALFWRMGRAAPRERRALRIGLRCIVTGLALTLLFAVQRIVFVVAHALGAGAPAIAKGPLFDVLRAVGVLLALGGGLVPAVGWVRATLGAYRSLRALRPLWQAMREAFPDVILFPPRRALLERFGVDDVHLRLYRRVIEIRDGLLALREHLPADAAAQAAAYLDARGTTERTERSEGHEGVPGQRGGGYPDRAALAEACGIALALHLRRSGQRAPGGGGRWAHVGADLADEVGWMARVSACLRRPEPAGFVAARMSTMEDSPVPRPSGRSR